jgi:hypothetical protein
MKSARALPALIRTIDWRGEFRSWLGFRCDAYISGSFSIVDAFGEWNHNRRGLGLAAVALFRNSPEARLAVLPELESLLGRESLEVALLTAHLLVQEPVGEGDVLGSLARLFRRNIDQDRSWKDSRQSGNVEDLIDGVVLAAIRKNRPSLFDPDQFLAKPMLPGVEDRSGFFEQLLSLYDVDVKKLEVPLRMALRSDDLEIRQDAAALLKHVIGYTLPTDLVRELTEGLSDPNPEVRGEFATALTNTEIDQVEIIPALAKALNDDQVGVRANVAFALSEFGERAIVALPALVDLLEEKGSEVHTYAASAIGSMGVKARSAGPKVVSLLARHTTSTTNAPRSSSSF